MARLIEVRQVERCPSPLAVRVGDVLVIRASGSSIREGGSAVELWGPFLPAVVSDTGEVLSPEGTPGTVLVRARAPGPASLDVVLGDPWHAPRVTTLRVEVGP